jgi:hypothetical protein
MLQIINKYAGTCDECDKWVKAGQGVARKYAGDKRFTLYCKADAGETHGLFNPWKSQHIRRSFAAYGASAYEARAIDSEYANTDALAQPCTKEGCGGTAHWKATVGAPICPDCGTMIVHTPEGSKTVETRSHEFRDVV